MKTDGGVKVRTDHGEEIEADAVLFATGIFPLPSHRYELILDIKCKKRKILFSNQ